MTPDWASGEYLTRFDPGADGDFKDSEEQVRFFLG
jgi:hypothetical protein